MHSHFICLALFIPFAALSLADMEKERTQRQFLSPSYNSLNSLYQRYLYENLYADVLAGASQPRLSWNGLLDTEGTTQVLDIQ